MNDLIKKLKKNAILSVAACAAAATIGTTFAWQTWDLSVTNQLRSHTTEVRVDEEGFDPGTGYKPVKFVNEGSSSVFLRVSYTEYWEVKRGSEEYLLTNTNGDGVEVATKHWTNEWNDKSLWFDGGDGWYYYKRVLKAEAPDNETSLILNGVTFENVEKDSEYDKGDYHLYFKAEVVQCSDGCNTLNSEEVNRAATEAMFGKQATVDEDGMVTWQ